VTAHFSAHFPAKRDEGKEFFVPFELHSPGELAPERIEQFLRHSVRCNFLEWNGALKLRTRGPSEAAIEQRRDAAMAF
jgi:hypothetical protein